GKVHIRQRDHPLAPVHRRMLDVAGPLAARADGRQRNLIARRRETGAAENVAGHDEDGARQRRLLQKRPASEGASVFSLHGRDSVWWMGSSQTVPHFALT